MREWDKRIRRELVSRKETDVLTSLRLDNTRASQETKRWKDLRLEMKWFISMEVVPWYWLYICFVISSPYISKVYKFCNKKTRWALYYVYLTLCIPYTFKPQEHFFSMALANIIRLWMILDLITFPAVYSQSEWSNKFVADFIFSRFMHSQPIFFFNKKILVFAHFVILCFMLNHELSDVSIWLPRLQEAKHI